MTLQLTLEQIGLVVLSVALAITYALLPLIRSAGHYRDRDVVVESPRGNHSLVTVSILLLFLLLVMFSSLWSSDEQSELAPVEEPFYEFELPPYPESDFDLEREPLTVQLAPSDDLNDVVKELPEDKGMITSITIFSIKVGVFRNYTYAQNRLKEMLALGFNSWIESGDDGHYRVLEGNFASKADAQEVARAIPFDSEIVQTVALELDITT